MRVFLTGGTGFIGQALAKTILQRGWQLDALVRRPEGPAARWLASEGATLTPGDVTQTDSMREAMANADLVIHNAGVYEFGADAALRQRMTSVNVDGTRNTLGLALELKVPRTLYVSTVWATGATGPDPCDESYVRSSPFINAYEKTKAQAHEAALQCRQRGLSLVIAMPNGVVGPNDHSVFGYLLRMYLMRLLPPMAWSPASIYSLVHVDALAEGIALAAEKASAGQDFLFCGEPTSLKQMFDLWRAHPGAFAPSIWLPPWMMKLQFAPLEPVLRAAGLPAFLSRETVTTGTVHLNYSAAKAKQALGWTHPSAHRMWDSTITRERELLQLSSRRGLRARLRPLEVVPTSPDAAHEAH